MAKAKVTNKPTITKKPRSKSVGITDIDELENVFNKGAKGFTTAIATSTARILYNNTKSGVYDDYEPEMYQRTYQMLNAIVGPQFNNGPKTVGSKGQFSACAGFDIDRMQVQPWKWRTVPGKTGKRFIWGAHSDYLSKDRRAETIERFEQQHFVRYKKGRLYPDSKNYKPIYERKPVEMMKSTEWAVNDILSGYSGTAKSIGHVYELLSRKMPGIMVDGSKID